MHIPVCLKPYTLLFTRTVQCIYTNLVQFLCVDYSIYKMLRLQWDLSLAIPKIQDIFHTRCDSAACALAVWEGETRETPQSTENLCMAILKICM